MALKELQDKLEMLDNEIAELIACRKEIRRSYRVERSKLPRQVSPDPNLDRLLNFLEDNPGANRADIREVLPELTEKSLSNLLTKARQAALIENHGSRAFGAWYITSV